MVFADPPAQIQRRVAGGAGQRQPDLRQIFGRIGLAPALIDRDIGDLVFGMQFAQVPGGKAQKAGGLGRGKAAQVLAGIGRKVALQMHPDGLVQCGCVALKFGENPLLCHAALVWCRRG